MATNDVRNNNTSDIISATRAAFGRAAYIISQYASDDAKDALDGAYGAPRRIDTGNLRNSISGAVDDQGDDIIAVIGTNVEYAQYVHDGTTKMTANRFLKDALTHNIDEYREIVVTSLRSG